MPSLLRTEAIERADLLTVTMTRIDLDLTASAEVFSSSTVIDFSCRRPGAATFVDFKGRELTRAVLNGRELDPTDWVDGRMPLPDLQAENTLVIDGLMGYSSDGEGLHRHIDPADGYTYLYAMSFLDAAPRWFACFDQPDLKSRYQLQISAPAEWTVIGNGPSVNLAPGRWRITPARPLSSYYVTLVAGSFVSVFDEHDGIPLGVYARASLSSQLQAEAADILAVTKAAFDYYHRVFGVRYPFGEYHQAFVPDFNAGAMENPGCVTFRDQYIFRGAATTSERGSRAGTIAHEMAHMWFGDLVTMKWWDDLWLNESFAEYMAHRACQEATRYPLWTEFGVVRKDWGYVADQSASTHPVAGNGSADAQSALADFDGISYAKGAAVLKQLVAYLGDDIFFAGLNDYFAAHSFGNAEFADLMASWTAAGAKDLDEWAENWLRTSGLDTIAADRSGEEVRISRRTPPLQPADRTHALRVVGLDAAGRAVSEEPMRLSGRPGRLRLPASAVVAVPDAADETWAKIRFGEGWQRVGSLLSDIEDPAIRVVIYNSIRDGVRDCELAPQEALELIVAPIVVEPNDVVLRSMLQFAQDQLAGPYCPPESRSERRARVCAAAHRVLARVAAGSDLQLAAFRIAIRSSNDPQLLAAWLRAEQLPPGVRLDAELTWAIVGRLTGLTGEEALIDQALQADQSAAAQVHAARARAGLPSPLAKERAFTLMMRPSKASAYELYATAEGFFRPSQSELTADYVPRYFAEIAGTAAFRSGWALGQVALLSFPLAESTESTLELAETALQRTDLAAPVRRSLVDGTDRLRRAVRSRATFSPA